MRLNCYSDRVPVLIIAYAVLRTPRVVTELARPVKDRRRMCVGRAGKSARVAEAMVGGSPDNRLCATVAQDCGSGFFEADPPQGRHWRNPPETVERNVQSTNAASSKLRNLGD